MFAKNQSLVGERVDRSRHHVARPAAGEALLWSRAEHPPRAKPPRHRAPPAFAPPPAPLSARADDAGGWDT